MLGHQKSERTELWRASGRFRTHVQMANRMLAVKPGNGCARRTLPPWARGRRTQKPTVDQPVSLSLTAVPRTPALQLETDTANTHTLFICSLSRPLRPRHLYSVECVKSKKPENIHLVSIMIARGRSLRILNALVIKCL